MRCLNVFQYRQRKAYNDIAPQLFASRDNGKKKGPRTRPSGTLYFRLLTHKTNCLQIASRTSDALSLLCQPFPTWIVIFQIPSADNNNNANIYTG